MPVPVPTKEIERLLMTLIDEAHDDFVEEFIGEEVTARSYEEVGMLTRDCGLVIKTASGNEFTVTIQRRR